MTTSPRASPGPRSVLTAIARTAARLCEAGDALIFQAEGDRLRLVAKHGRLRAMWRLGEILPITRGTVLGRAVLDRRTVHVRDLARAARHDFKEAAVLQRETGARTVLSTPLLRGRTAIGAIVIRRTKVHPFTAKQIALLRTFADQAAMAIENARLLTELEAKNHDLTVALEQQTATSEILRVISGTPTDLQPVFDAIASSSTRLCDAAFSVVFRFDGEMITVAADDGRSPGTLDVIRSAYPAPPGKQSISAQAILERRVISIADAQNSGEYPHSAERARAIGYHSILAVPMLRGDAAIGTINVARLEVAPFTDTQIALLQTFADQAVIAIANVRLFTELEARNSELRVALEQQTATSELLKVIGQSTFNLQPVFETLAENGVRLCGATQALVLRFDGQFLRPVVTHNLTPANREFLEQNPIAPGRHTASARAALERRTIHIHDVQSDPEYTYGDGQFPFRSLLAVPLLRADELLGVIAIQRNEMLPFTDSQVALMETFADQAAIAIENARLLRELQTKNADLTEALEQQTATSEILRVISSSPTDIQPVLDTVAESAARLCEAFDSAIWRLDGERLLLVAHHGPIPLGPIDEFTLPLVRGTVAGRSVLDGRTVHVADTQTEAEEFPESSENARRQGFRTILCVPLMREGVAIGSLQTRRSDAQLFTERQVALLETFADQAVIAIENVRLFTELDTRNGELRVALEQQTATSELLKVIGRSAFDLQPVFETLAENAVRLCEAERGLIMRFDGELLRFAVGHNVSTELREFFERHPIPPGRHSNAGRAALERRTVHNHDVLSDPEYSYGGSQVDPYRTVLAIPMLRGDELLGVIIIYRHEVRPFTDSQIALMETFADQAAIAIENARLLTELQTKNADLTEALEQQTATSEILQVISSSPTDVQPVFDIIGERAERLCTASVSVVSRFDAS